MVFKLLTGPGLLPENQFTKETRGVWPEYDGLDWEDIDRYFYDLTKDIQVDDSINDWKLLIRVILGGMMDEKRIGISKRGFTYPSDKEKDVSIRISLPTTDEADWGIKDKRRFDKYAKTNSKYVEYLPVDYSRYDNMKDYIENTIKYALDYLFTKGINLKGKKIKRNN